MLPELSLHAVAGLAVGYALVRMYRWIRHRSALLGAIVAAGMLLQAGMGLLLFWVSYLDLPLLERLHSGDGFWEVAPDAALYTLRAARAVHEGLGVIHSNDPSPAYVRLLTIWMHLVGISPASGMFLNLALYGLLCWLVVHVWRPSSDWRRDLPCAVLLASMSFSPLLVFNGTQTLKDNTYVFLLAVGCVGAWLLLGPVLSGRRGGASFAGAVAGLGVLLLALYGMAGIRAYHAFMLWGSLAFTLALFALPWSLDRLRRNFPLAMAIVLLTFLSCLAGAMPYVDAAVGAIKAESNDGPEGLSEWVTGTLRLIESSRLGFENTVGGTNIVVGPPPPSMSPPPPNAPAPPAAIASVSTPPVVPTTRVVVGPPPAAVSTAPPAAAVPTGVPPAPPSANVEAQSASVALPGSGLLLRVEREAVGLAVFFVPISLLRALSIVEFSGGRGLLLLTDVDTLCLDATMLASLLLLYQRWNSVRRHLPYVSCLLLLACVSTVLLAYVITNFGTLVRLRAMAIVPVWMAALAASPSAGRDPDRTSPQKNETTLA